jgi:cysteinyl-tRNA synthetase
MEESREALRRIDDWVARLRETAGEENVRRPTSNIQHPTGEETGFEDALDDDLNISGALGALFETIRKTNRELDLGQIGADLAGSRLRWWERINHVLAIERKESLIGSALPHSRSSGSSEEQSALPSEIADLANARTQARLAKDWRKSDELRDELAARGWEARDTKDGQKLTRRAGV